MKPKSMQSIGIFFKQKMYKHCNRGRKYEHIVITAWSALLVLPVHVLYVWLTVICIDQVLVQKYGI